ncbi:hypothetical protein JYK14_14580 [Siccirubricoccus sp. KC 17139]|uniref:Uncharacterized protein n=1 Tax=Siccirubricoccus soli TaxID=2899147 RepID=A0ABT1D629_9PROT|nr:hypothetical protein [Siccirubricoccus soli]MCO6417382.1 hypothetical protein [Siccirubricoccus soli]MCP2683517.1 hypothetical protein [Siccirubricoccus soli]
MADSEQQRSWCIRVLGVDPAAPGAPAGPGASVLAGWQAAKEAADAQLDALARALRSRGDPDFDQIAEYGLFGITGGQSTVGLIAALRGYDAAAPAERAAAGAALGKAVAAWRAQLHASALVDALEDNPLGVTVDLRGTFDAAFRQIVATLRQPA